MDPVLILIIAILLMIVLWLVYGVRSTTIYEFQRGLLYQRGKFVRVLEPGQHYYLRAFTTITRVDNRIIYFTVPGQEVLTADQISLKISLAASYRIQDPYLAVQSVTDYSNALYLLLQLNLRDVIGALPVDELLAQRERLSTEIFTRSIEQAAELGLELKSASLKDIMFPGELKTIFAQVVSARKQGQAALERARGEAAALRNLSNAARLLEANPQLGQLRLYQTIENSSGNTFVVLPSGMSLPAEGTGV